MTDERMASDGELLKEFAATGSETAFGEIVRRHGPMVRSVCQRVLTDYHEAEDAAQAVFLALAQKAGGLRSDPSIGGWLHRVAWCVAMDARKARDRRQRHEEAAMREVSNDDASAVDQVVFRAEVDTAIAGLPDRYRRPVVLFHLEDRSGEETARLLGLSSDALRTRLSRAREMLRRKLVRRGVTVGSVGTLTTLLSAEAGAATLPATFVSATVKAAGLAAAGKLAAGVGTGVVSANVAALTKGACNMLFWSSVKTAAIAVAVTGAVVTTGTVAAQKAMEASPSVGVVSNPQTVDLRSLVRLRREGNLLVCDWISPERPVDLGRFETANPRLSCVAYGVKTDTIPGAAMAAEIYGTNMAERAGSGMWHFKMRANAANSNFWVMVMYGTKAPIACIEYIQGSKQLRVIRTVWTADGKLDPDKRLDVSTDRPDIEELKAKAGDELKNHLAPVLAMITPGDLLGPVDSVLRFTEADNGKTVTVPLGQSFEVAVNNGRDGAGWEAGATEITGKSVERADKLRRMNCDSFTPDDPSTNSTKGTYVYRYRTVATGESSLRLDHLYPSGPEPVARRRTQFIGEFKLIVRVTEAYGAPALDEQAAKQTAQGWVSDLLAGRVDQVLGASVTPFCWDKRELVSTSEELKRKLAAVVRVKSVRNIPIREVVVLKDKSAVEVAERFKLLDTAGLTFVAVYVERDRGDTEGIAVAIKPGAQPRVVGFSD